VKSKLSGYNTAQNTFNHLFNACFIKINAEKIGANAGVANK